MNNEPTLDIEPEPAGTVVKREKQVNIMLSEFVEDYEPAKTYTDLDEQVHLAKQFGADSIEADPKLIRQLTLKSGYPSDVGFLCYHDVKVWIPGFTETHGHLLSQTIEEKVFGHSKIKIQPIMDLGEKPK